MTHAPDLPSRPLSTSKTTASSVISGSTNSLGWRGGRNRKWKHNDSIDAAIRAGFALTRGAEKTIACLVEELGWPDRAVRRRAQELKVYRPDKNRGRFSEAEIDILRAASVFSTNVVMKRLEDAGFGGHTRSSVNSKRARLGLEPVNKEARRVWQSSPAIDEAISQAFGKKYERLGSIRNAMKATGWPQHAVVRRAVELGLTHPRSDIPWTEAEEKLLEKYAYQSLPSIQIHLRRDLGKHRTQSSIATKRGRMALLGNLHGMDLTALADALGVGGATVRRWLEGGAIRAILRFPELQAVGRHVWFFPNEEIRRFILEHVEMIDLTRVEKFWFVDLVANGKAFK